MKRALIQFFLLAIVVISPALPSFGQYVYTTNFFPVADASIRSDAPDGKDGSSNSLTVGVSSDGSSTNRGLFRFDVSSIPTNATVTNVTLSLIALKQPSAPYYFGLYLLLTNWVESEVTWNNRSALMPWIAPGGLFGTDYFGTDSSYSLLVGPAGTTNQFTNSFPPSGLNHDVQLWVNNPSQNFGWILICLDGNNTGSAIQLGSRENTGNEPVLTVGYTLPFTPPTLKNPGITNGQFCFSFNIEAGRGYQLQRTGDLSSTNWETFLVLDPAPIPQEVYFCDPSPLSTSNLFYRVHY